MDGGSAGMPGTAHHYNQPHGSPLTCIATHCRFRTACPTCGRPNLDERCEHDDSFLADVPAQDVLVPALDLLRDTATTPFALHRPLYACRYT